MISTLEAHSKKNKMEQDRKLLLPEAPNFSRFLEQTFKGTVKIADVREVRQGFSSEKNRFLSSLLGQDRFRSKIDEDKFYKMQKRFPRSKKYFIGPFHQCLRTTIGFIPSEEELTEYRRELRDKNLGDEEELGRDEEHVEGIIADFINLLKGEFKVYPEFRNKDGKAPMTYNGFRPGVGYHNKIGLDYIGLIFGSYSSLVKLIDHFDVSWAKEKRGPFWKSGEWKRFDGYPEIPFP